jgi:hypothetical protein
MLRRVALVRTDVSEELSDSSSGWQELVNYEQRQLQLATGILHRHRRDNLKSYTTFLIRKWKKQST